MLGTTPTVVMAPHAWAGPRKGAPLVLARPSSRQYAGEPVQLPKTTQTTLVLY